MDIFSACGMPVSKDLKNLPSSEDLRTHCELLAGPSVLTTKTTADLSLSDLAACLRDFPSIKDDQKLKSVSVNHSDAKDIRQIDKDDMSRGSNQSELDSVSEKCLTKSATFPCYGKIESYTASVDEENDDGYGKDDLSAEVLAEKGSTKSAGQSCQCSVSLPTPLKLISAMKGSREKRGIPPVKLSVKWAPDVYDPPPSAVSHVPSSKIQRQRTEGRKHGKNKHKGGGRSSRGSKGKDKKQARKYVESSNRCFQLMGEYERNVNGDEPPAELVDFDVDSPDPFCGRSFLKKSVTKLHFPVAEAT